MSQSLAKNLIHLVFSTKDRTPTLHDDVRVDLHHIMGGIFRDLNSPALTMNSVNDHIHILFNLHRTKALSDVVMEVKRGTSVWIKEKHPRYAGFYWQGGYGAFSVSQSRVETITDYLANQNAHHLRRSFQDEFRELLGRHEIEFDERYVWD